MPDSLKRKEDVPKYVIVTLDDETDQFIVRLIEALEIERNVAVRAGDPDPDALAAIDDDVRKLGRWIDWLPERLRTA